LCNAFYSRLPKGKGRKGEGKGTKIEKLKGKGRILEGKEGKGRRK
jgi:hypothetical protein